VLAASSPEIRARGHPLHSSQGVHAPTRQLAILAILSLRLSFSPETIDRGGSLVVMVYAGHLRMTRSPIVSKRAAPRSQFSVRKRTAIWFIERERHADGSALIFSRMIAAYLARITASPFVRVILSPRFGIQFLIVVLSNSANFSVLRVLPPLFDFLAEC